jgi:molybdopterin converting factor subunit 1
LILAENPNNEIAVRVLFFGAARDAVGQTEVDVSLKGNSTAANAFEEVLEKFPKLRRFGRSLLFAVNQEYAAADREVKDGDELAVFPPVSGGSGVDTETRRHGDGETGTAGVRGPQTGSPDEVLDSPASTPKAERKTHDFFELTTDAIDVGAVARRVVLPECGATVTLDGYAREWTKGRQTLHLIYEAYAPMAQRELERLGREAHERFQIALIGIVHRTGRLEIGETSVVIAVSAPHRRAAFEACEWAIRELKRTVPIWKKEVFADGEVWVEGEGPKSAGLGGLPNA